MAYNENQIPISSLCYYFDSQKQDSLDHGVLGFKRGQVIALRDKLLALPDAEFNVAIQALQHIVQTKGSTKVNESLHQRKDDAMRLFNQLDKTVESNSTTKVTPV